jgi:hypothetical protein
MALSRIIVILKTISFGRYSIVTGSIMKKLTNIGTIHAVTAPPRIIELKLNNFFIFF